MESHHGCHVMQCGQLYISSSFSFVCALLSLFQCTYIAAWLAGFIFLKLYFRQANIVPPSAHGERCTVHKSTCITLLCVVHTEQSSAILVMLLVEQVVSCCSLLILFSEISRLYCGSMFNFLCLL